MRPPVSLRDWLHANLFADRLSALITVLFVAATVYWLPGWVDWAVLSARFQPDAATCEAARHAGACWGVVAEKYRFILFGRYPFGEQWRPLLATALLFLLLAASGARWLRPRALIAAALGIAPVCLVLMGGGMAGLTPVATDLWGGLPLTLLLTSAAIVMALPLAIVVALARLQTTLPLVRLLATMYVELVRGVPLISVLFLASFLLPIMLPPGLEVDVLLRVLGGLVLFAAAYLSETVRGGLQAVSADQHHAASALGFSKFQAMRWIILPQALRAVVPSIMNSAVSIFKDTSLVTVVSLYELTGALSLALAGDAQWRSFYLEGYLFIGAIYWLGCFSMSQFSRRFELTK